MSNIALIEACEATAGMAQSALEWIAEPKNDVRVGQERAFLERSIRSQAYHARRLAQSVDRPMSVGVFGPSQAGKSYLVSVLARKGDTLTALFQDAQRPEVDFITDINPYGEKEATGLVTRFSIHKIKTPAGYPVALRLLTQTDLLKILTNSYFFDGDQQEEKLLTPEDIDRHIKSLESKRSPGYVDVLREEDIWDLEDYFQRQLRRTEAKVFGPYWDRFARLAPKLGLRERAELFSILWGRHQQLTDLYLLLLESLAKLGFADEAFCPLDALVPAATGILNVETLAGLGQTDAEPLKVSTKDGKVVALTRAVITALAAELRIVLKDTPWPFFEHTDLLDFPGYRSRTLHNLDKYLKEAKSNALKELFLRGKVDYLFQRYTAEQELTSMLLCLRPSNLDVTTLPAVIEEWIGVTHGPTPKERDSRPTLLFFLLTMFDQHLAEKAGDESADPGLRFQARLEASLLKPFAKVAGAWPLEWTPGTPFQNCFWIRNPNYKAEGIIKYEGRREVSVHPHKVARIAELRNAYAQVPEVQRHFRNPLEAFDEVMKLNDGGISYLARNLALVCKPGMKQAQVRARLGDLRRRLFEALSPHYIATDADKRLEERKRIAREAASDLQDCALHQMFGTFLRGLCVDRARLAATLYEARTRGPSGGEDEPQRATTRSGNGNWGDALFAVASGGSDQAPQRQPTRSTPAQQLARTAMQFWSESIHDASDDSAFATLVRVRRETLREIAVEVIGASRRLKLEEKIETTLAKVWHIGSADKAAEKATIIAERHINGFITRLGMPAPDAPVAFDAAGLVDDPIPFQNNFAFQWVRSFGSHVLENAKSADGLVHDVQQNMLLGEIIKRIEQPVPAA